MSTKAPSINVPRSSYAGIAAIATNAGHLSKIASVLEQVGPEASVDDLTNAFAAAANISQSDASGIVVQLMTLHSLLGKVARDPNDLFDGITSALRRSADKQWDEANIEKWITARAQIISVLDPRHPLAAFEKTIRLMYDHPQILLRSRIITDIRPVFTNTVESIARAIVSHSLLIEYHDDGQRRTLQVAIDSNDIEHLMSQCERARRKASTVKSELKKLNLPTVAAGNAND